MIVQKLVNFNGVEVLTPGRVLEQVEDFYIVRFVHDNVEFRGRWPISACIVLSR